MKSSLSVSSPQQVPDKTHRFKSYKKSLSLFITYSILFYGLKFAANAIGKIFKERQAVFTLGEKIPFQMDQLTSTHTQIPKNYHNLPFCDYTVKRNETIPTPSFAITMQDDIICRVQCQVTLSTSDANHLKKSIREQYRHNFVIDNLIAAAKLKGDENNEWVTTYAGGFPIGFVSNSSENGDEIFIYNHLNIMIYFHEESNDGYSVVGVKIHPMSIRHNYFSGFVWNGESIDGFTKPLDTCTEDHMKNNHIRENQIVEEGAQILYTYDVIWKHSEGTWTSRWNRYLAGNTSVPVQVHWYSIINTVILIFFFLGIPALSVLIRNLRKDISGYNAMAALTDEEKLEEKEEIGWKLIHKDVFRPPSSNPMLFCVMVGTGLQLCITFALIIILSLTGFINPARRGNLMVTLTLLYVLCGSVAGYVSCRLYKTLSGRSFQRCAIFTATLFPGLCFCLVLLFNTVLLLWRSSVYISFLHLIQLAVAWCCMYLPIVQLGALFGWKAAAISFPTDTSTVHRQIPEPAFMLNPNMSIVMAGLVPFAATYIELFFVMTSLWMDQYYCVFGFTLLIYIFFILACVEVTILLLYYQLCSENHRWWWFSFLASGCTALYVLVYSFVWYFILDINKSPITFLLYFGYMMIVCFGIFLVAGSIGALSSFWFVLKIFGAIKID